MRQWDPDEPGVALHFGRESLGPLRPPWTPAPYLPSLALSWQRNSRLIPRRGGQTPCFCPTLRGTGTNHAALGSREAILSPTSFSLLTGNLHQLFRLLSEGAEQTQPQQDTQVGAAWRDLGGHGSPLHPRPVSLGPVCALVCGCAWAGLQAGMLVAGCAHSVCCFSAFWQGAHIVCSAFGALSSLPVL